MLLFASSDAATLGISLIVAVVAPVVLAFVQSYIKRKDQEFEWERQDRLSAKLDEIHTLVNGNLTAHMEDALISKEAELAALRELLVERGQDASEALRTTIEAIETIVVQKRAELAERKLLVIQSQKKSQGRWTENPAFEGDRRAR